MFTQHFLQNNYGQNDSSGRYLGNYSVYILFALVPASPGWDSEFGISNLSSSSAAASCAASATLAAATKAESDTSATPRGSCSATQRVPGFLTETPSGSGSFAFRSCSISSWHLAHLLPLLLGVDKFKFVRAVGHGDPADRQRRAVPAIRGS